jgi:hypothetical protein
MHKKSCKWYKKFFFHLTGPSLLNTRFVKMEKIVKWDAGHPTTVKHTKLKDMHLWLETEPRKEEPS